MEQPQPVTMQTEFSSANQYYPQNDTAYSQNGTSTNTNLNIVPMYQQDYSTPHQIYGPQDMNHNIPNYSQELHNDPFKPHYEYESQGHHTLVYNNTDSGLGYENTAMIYNGDVSSNYYNESSSNQFRQTDTSTSPPVKRGPGRPTKKILTPGSSDKSFICETCYKPLGTYQSLKKHMVTHTGLRQYKCDLCGNSYTQKHNLTKHLRVHSGERPYSCSYCPASYRTSHLLKNHMNRHPEYNSPSSAVIEERSNDSEMMESSEEADTLDNIPPKYSEGCEEANTVDNISANANESGTDLSDRFSERQSLSENLLKSAEKSKALCETDEKKVTEKPETETEGPGKPKLECNQCDQIFESRVKLMRHKNEHNSQKTLSCNFCNASFRWKASLDIHMRRHKGKKQPAYELKGLKIKNGNRITLKIVNSEKNAEKKTIDTDDKETVTEKNTSGENTTAGKKPVANAPVAVNDKTEKTSLTNVQTRKNDNTDQTKSIENHDIRPNSRRTANINPVVHNHETRMRTSEAVQTKRNDEFIGVKPTKPKKFECDICGQTFTQNFSLKRHKSNKICTR